MSKAGSIGQRTVILAPKDKVDAVEAERGRGGVANEGTLL